MGFESERSFEALGATKKQLSVHELDDEIARITSGSSVHHDEQEGELHSLITNNPDTYREWQKRPLYRS